MTFAFRPFEALPAAATNDHGLPAGLAAEAAHIHRARFLAIQLRLAVLLPAHAPVGEPGGQPGRT